MIGNQHALRVLLMALALGYGVGFTAVIASHAWIGVVADRAP